MESPSTSADKQHLVSSFLEIAVGQSADTAVQFLQATSWRLDEAIQLFYLGNDGGGGGGFVSDAAAVAPSAMGAESSRVVENAGASDMVEQGALEDEVRPPLPVKRETLYGDFPLMRLQQSPVVAFRNFEQESKRPAVWDPQLGTASTTNGSRDNLASLYSPPLGLIYQGSFEQAKLEASGLGKWLLINLQSNGEFSSHMLNRDTWSNEAVEQTIRTNFIFWQVYHDTSEGKKVSNYYHLLSYPAILVIDPITGQKMHAWSGMVQPERLLEELLPYLDKGPKEHNSVLPQKRPREISSHRTSEKAPIDEDEEIQRAIEASMEDAKGSIAPTDDEPKPEVDDETGSNTKPSYPPLPEEPKGSKELLCRVSIRLPSGRRLQRNFLRSDQIKLLWSFCSSQLEDGEARRFHFTQAIPGGSNNLEYESNLSFEEAASRTSDGFIIGRLGDVKNEWWLCCCSA